MDWVHCNSCYLSPPSKEYKFLLTSCGHIFCTKCYNKPKIPCLVCKNKCMITPLRPNMSPDVQLFFMDPLEVATKLHKQLLKVLDFQKTQRKRLTAYRINNIKKSQTTENNMQQEIQRLTTENKHLKSLLAQAKENRHPNTGSRRPSPFGGGAPSPANSLDRRMRVSPAGAGRPQYSNSFAQVLGSRITPPPPIFQRTSGESVLGKQQKYHNPKQSGTLTPTPRTTPSPRSLEDCKRSVEYNSRRQYKSYSGNTSR